MGCIRVTTRPHYYAEMERMAGNGASADLSVDTPERREMTGEVEIQFSVAGLREKMMTAKQSHIRFVIAEAMRSKGVYHRLYTCTDSRGYYEWENLLLHQTSVRIGPVKIEELSVFEELFAAFSSAGLYPEDDITITYYPEGLDIKLLINLSNILESRRELVEQALSLQEEMKIVVSDGLALSIELGAFSYPKIEAATFLIVQASQMALATKKARMKAADGSNPKYQIRSWLLRLGFIGAKFERARKTLLEGLEGNAAFFTEEGRIQAQEKAKEKRQGMVAMSLLPE